MLLELQELATHFFTEEGVVRAVDGVSFGVSGGEVLCVVGESGSGKSVASQSILGLVPNPPGRIVAGKILFSGGGAGSAGPEDLVTASEARLRAIRGDRIAMIFQDPMTSLNPYMKIGAQLVEVLEVHQRATGADARKRAAQMLDDVGIPAPESRLDDYPHQLSGGMRQRVMIAMALLCEPDVLIADEPTTALDVTIQAQILALIEERKTQLGLAVILITHDLGVVARMADRVVVMYAGRVAEQDAEAVFAQPRHPYTIALQRSIPRLDTAMDEPLVAIEGLPPAPGHMPAGCPFHPRCSHVQPVCKETYPEERLLTIGGKPHRVSCHIDLGADTTEREANP